MSDEHAQILTHWNKYESFYRSLDKFSDRQANATVDILGWSTRKTNLDNVEGREH